VDAEVALTRPLPVAVWVHGEGTPPDGSGSLFTVKSSRAMACAVNVNYRLGIFGFFAYPDFTKESPHHAAGNYGLGSGIMALRWVRTTSPSSAATPRM
jgi:para-nitrobenzyl esterase